MRRIPARELFALMLSAVLSLVTALPVGAQAGAESGWTQFRGPNATGIAVVTKAPPIEFGPDRHMLWKGAVPPGHSSPVIWGDRLFLTAFDAEQQRLLLLALDRKTGRTLWRQEVT